MQRGAKELIRLIPSHPGLARENLYLTEKLTLKTLVCPPLEVTVRIRSSSCAESHHWQLTLDAFLQGAVHDTR